MRKINWLQGVLSWFRRRRDRTGDLLASAFGAWIDRRTLIIMDPHEKSLNVEGELLFDSVEYLGTYPDVAAAGVDPQWHYENFGRSEGRFPISLMSDDAEARIALALKKTPDDEIAIGLAALLAINLKGIDGVRFAIDLYGENPHAAVSPKFDLVRLIERWAEEVLFDWLGFHSNLGVPELRELYSKMKAVFPQSQGILAVDAILNFEIGELDGAECGLNVAMKSAISERLRDHCARALLQISDARLTDIKTPSHLELLIIDTSFPSKVSSFRFGEFSAYLECFDKSFVSVRPDLNLFKYGEGSGFSELMDEYQKKFGAVKKVGRFSSSFQADPKLAYCVFLSLADLFFYQIGLRADNYVFTLYPGGGFALNDPGSDKKLRQLCSCSKLKKIITTQIVSYEYLIDGGFISPDRVCHIFGGVVPEAYSAVPANIRPSDRSRPLQICFVAQRYSLIGAEKGYDVFAAIVRRFSNSCEVHFNVVGDFDYSTVDLGGARNVTFNGVRPASFFSDFYSQMDIILSPNISISELDVDYPNSFDGFPTTAVVEAGLRGVAMFITDFLDMNRHLGGERIFENDELIIINRDASDISRELEFFIENRVALNSLRLKGQKALRREFGFSRQMVPRIELLKKYMN